MKSRITIEVDFENNNVPVIQILQSYSDDVRDKLIKSFTECVGGSSWCRIEWKPVPYNGHPRIIHIIPIPPNAIKEQAGIMLEQVRVNYESAFGAYNSTATKFNPDVPSTFTLTE